MLVGGDHGPAIIPGDAPNSLLIQAVKHAHADIKMPKDAEPLSGSDIETLAHWIDQGAIWPGSEKHESQVRTNEELVASHWAYQAITSPSVPTLSSRAWKSWTRNPIDHFIAAKLEHTEATPGPPAKPDIFLRRLSYGITGLPPKENDTIEVLLASPEYGRKWGRHWLDVVRYSDTAGDNADYPIPEMALFRDYIVDAFNDDLPFNELIKEQLAGDLMDSHGEPELRRRRVIATSFISNSMRFCDDLRNDLPLVIDDTVDAVGQSFMAMTLSCAKCHNHKSEPIPAADYYAIYGFFSSTRFPYAGREGRPVPVNFAPTGMDAQANERIREIDDQLRDELLNKGRLSNTTSERGQRVLKLLQEQRNLSELAFGVMDARQVGDANIHKKGNHKNKGKIVPRGFFSAITPDAQAEIPEGQSGRLQLAEWIASNKHPLTARVIVNRIWSWHFGKGLVPTVNNFGISGEKPTHPELLDYLARQFIDSGWSMKALHRLILDSATYRQAWRPDTEGYSQDSANTLYWRFDRRRLSAEELRDSALAAAGQLDLTNPGKHPFPDMGSKHFTQHKPYEQTFHHNNRSIYLMTSRIRRQEFSTLFDAADPTRSTGKRRTSIVPLQALYLLNNERFDQITKQLSQRLTSSSNNAQDRIKLAYHLCYNRPPNQTELTRLTQFLKSTPSGPTQTPWDMIAQSLLLSNEFTYLD